MKRKQAAIDGDQPAESPTPKKARKEVSVTTERAIPDPETPSKRPRGRPPKTPNTNRTNGTQTPAATPTSKGKALFKTPTKSRVSGTTSSAPAVVTNADRSARRKSARAIIERNITGDSSEEDEEGGLALEIREEEDSDEEEEQAEEGGRGGGGETVEAEPQTPSKRGRGRPKGPTRKKSPTPPSDLPPHELYFWQNRPGTNKTSSHNLSSLSLLSHAEYHDAVATYKDPHESSIAFLHSLHAQSFHKWAFELDQSFSVCLYGYGSKRKLVKDFANHLHSFSPSFPPTTIITNGYLPNISLRLILTTIINTLPSTSFPAKLPTQPPELLDLLLSHLTTSPPKFPIYILINSLDAPPLRRPQTQTFLAQLSTHPSIHFLATCDTPNFPLLWDTNLRATFNWIFHDSTTFVPFDDGNGTGEIGGVVDSVNELMGRKGANAKGKDGVRWVLKSLPENARGLYRILVAEILASMDSDQDGMGNNDGDDEEDDDGEVPAVRRRNRDEGGEVPGGIEYRLLYQKAVEEFLCSSEMAFRTLLKEFHDHQMVVSQKGQGGGEMLGVPLRREEMESLLEEL
ncbi:MAG: Origin recognition complex subunit 2 [Icmadophila ericetorum]|nr:Origin recognition complex subunit 2 [Icmadophila ericetorum]